MQIQPAEEELLARAFFRTSEDERSFFEELRSTDFERRHRKGAVEESGISMFRLAKLSPSAMLGRIVGKRLANKYIGYAVCRVKDLNKLGVKYVGADNEDAHVSVRCDQCNLSSHSEAACEASESCFLRADKTHDRLLEVFEIAMMPVSTTSIDDLM